MSASSLGRCGSIDKLALVLVAYRAMYRSQWLLNVLLLESAQDLPASVGGLLAFIVVGIQNAGQLRLMHVCGRVLADVFRKLVVSPLNLLWDHHLPSAVSSSAIVHLSWIESWTTRVPQLDRPHLLFLPLLRVVTLLILLLLPQP